MYRSVVTSHANRIESRNEDPNEEEKKSYQESLGEKSLMH